MENSLFVVEGNHDIAYLNKVLKTLGYSESKSKDELNSTMKEFIPKSFPFKENSLNIFNYVPYFFYKDNKQIAIINADGEKNILEKIDIELSRPLEITRQIKNIFIFADGDLLNRDDKMNSIIDVDYDALEFEFIRKSDLESDSPVIIVEGHEIKVYFYIFPNNNSVGRLEDVILEAISIINPDLLNITKKFIDNVDAKYKAKWNHTNSKTEKATIGIIGNILIPSAANTTSICHKDVKWISDDTKDKVMAIKHIYEFLNEHVG